MIHFPFDPLEFPGVGFAAAPVLFKAYFLHETTTANFAPNADPALEFAPIVLPLIDMATVANPRMWPSCIIASIMLQSVNTLTLIRF